MNPNMNICDIKIYIVLFFKNVFVYNKLEAYKYFFKSSRSPVPVSH